jgi:hypothetical protein
MSGGDVALVIAAIVISNLVTAWFSWGRGFDDGVYRTARLFVYLRRRDVERDTAGEDARGDQ